MRIIFDMPSAGKLVELPNGRSHIVLVTAIGEALDGDGLLRNVIGGVVGKVENFGLDDFDNVWVDLSEVSDGSSK